MRGGKIWNARRNRYKERERNLTRTSFTVLLSRRPGGNNTSAVLEFRRRRLCGRDGLADPRLLGDCCPGNGFYRAGFYRFGHHLIHHCYTPLLRCW